MKIASRIGKDIYIDPYDPGQLNPNSYNLPLHNESLMYDEQVLDMKANDTASKLTIPESGLQLKPGIYLSRTIEHTRTDKLLPILEGRGSIGRLGMFVHVTASFDDVNFNGFWILENS